MEIISESAEQTFEFAKTLAKKLKAGDIIALYGELGAGKTVFVQGLAAGLGFEGRVFSPTFIIARPYKLTGGSQKMAEKKSIENFYHIDLYRIEKADDLETLGIEDFLADKTGICAIEWPEKIEKWLPRKTLKIKLGIVNEGTRKISLVVPRNLL